MKIDNRKDILLLLLYSPGATGQVNEPIAGRTRLVKMLYLFKKEALRSFQTNTEVNDDNFYQFHPWDFGPFSADIYDDLAFFLLRGFVESSLAHEEPLPESEAEWEKWRSSVSGEDDAGSVEEYTEERFVLTEKGLRFAEELYQQLTETQRQYIMAFKKRTNTAPLRALLRYVYTTYPDDTTMSKIKDKILGGYRF